MIYTDLTKKALKLCFEAHKEQKDKSGLPYVFHPFHVAEQMRDEDTTIVALLHDVVEDTDTSLDDLREMGFPPQTIEALALLTHEPGMPYEDYILRLRDNRLAAAVKKADLEHNSDMDRLDEIQIEDVARFMKYERALRVLTGRADLGKRQFPALLTPCYGIPVREDSRYCTRCGKEIDREKAEKTTAFFDLDATVCCCECGYDMPMTDSFCRRCGRKRRL